MRRARQRGSVLLYVVVILVSMGLLTAAIVPLAASYGERTTRRNDELRARLAFEAGVAQVKSQSLAMTLAVPATLSVAAGGVTGTLTVAANDAQLAKSLLVTGTMLRNGQTYRYSRVIGARQPSPFIFAVMSKADLNLPKAVTLGANGWGGDVFSNGKLTVGPAGAATVVNGNLAAVGTVNAAPGTTVTGRTLTGQTAIAWPTLSASNYSSAAGSLVASGKGTTFYTSTTLTSVTFTSWLTVADYNVWYCSNNLTVKGTISGKGTIYVAGNLTISGNLRYASSSDEVAFIVAGTVTVNSGVDTIDGFYFSNGNFTDQKDLTVSRGALVVSSYNTDKGLNIVRDDAVLNDEREAYRLRLPYYWP